MSCPESATNLIIQTFMWLELCLSRGHPVETGCPKHFQPIPLPQMMFFYSPWKPKVKECKGFCTVFHIPPYTLKNSGQQSTKIQQKHLIQEFDGGCVFFCLEHVFLTARGYEDVTYLPGRMLLFTGDQLHSVSPYKNPISSDRRIVLQGHGIFQNNQWWLFG